MGFLASLRSASHRWNTEVNNRRVEIVLDYNELRTVAAADGALRPDGQPTTFIDVLNDFKAAGATSVTVEEDTIGSLEQTRRLTILPGADRGATLLRPINAASEKRIVEALSHKTHFQVEVVPQAVTSEPRSRRGRRARFTSEPLAEPLNDILVREPIGVVRAVGIGLDPTVTALIHAGGLSVVGRVANYAGVDEPGIAWVLQDLKANGAKTVIFNGEEVLGFNGPLPSGVADPNKPWMQEYLAKNDLDYGTVEFGKQKGDIELQKYAPGRTVRVHTILGTEMVAADIPSNVQRFRLAARERNIRVLFVRLFTSEPRPVASNVKYISEIRTELTRAKLSAGVAHGYADLHTSRFVRILIGFGVAAGWGLLLDSITGCLTGDSGAAGYVFAFLPAIALIGLSGMTSFLGPKVVALAAGCIFPSLALLHKDQLRSGSGSGQSIALIAFLRFAVTIAITFIGIAAIVGLLADRLFLLKTDMFLGVKLVAIAPALIVAVVYGFSLRANQSRPWRVALKEAGAAILKVGTEPINLLQVTIAVTVLAAFLLIVMRSGNDSAVGVSPIELRLRGILDLLLPARPRFKDLVGHPALLIAFLLAARGHRKWALPFLVVGAIGLASMLDAFCHLHTPLPISLTRDFLAIGIGLFAYLVLYILILRPLLRRIPPAPAAN